MNTTRVYRRTATRTKKSLAWSCLFRLPSLLLLLVAACVAGPAVTEEAIQRGFVSNVPGKLSGNITDRDRHAGDGAADVDSWIGFHDIVERQSTVERQLVRHSEKVGMDLATALGNGKPTLIFFTPVALCRIRYCLQPNLVRERLTEVYANQINFVEAPVYAVDAPDKPRFPIVDLGVYLVEPYASWVPEVVLTEFGWGIAAPSVLLVGQNGSVLHRGGEFFAVEELRAYVN